MIFEIITEYTATEAFEVEADDADAALIAFHASDFDGEAYGGEVLGSKVIEVLRKYPGR